MPRAFDSDDSNAVLHFTELVDCPACELTFEGDFFDGATSVEDIVAPPVTAQTCPACGHRWPAELTGWNFFQEAG